MTRERTPRRTPSARAVRGAPALLAVDVGNSETTLGVFQDDGLVLSWRIRTEARTPDEALLLLRQLLAPEAVDLARLPTVLCSVVPDATPGLAHGLTKLTGVPTVVVGTKTVPSMPVRVLEPSNVGPDRLANALAAREIYGAPAIVVDLGTATTFDVVGPHGDFLGGAIAPGLSSSADALFKRGARLHRVDLAHPERAIGRSTEEALQAGIVLGHAGMVDALVTRILEELGVAAAVIGTGGLSPLLGEEASTIEHVDPSLTLKGLRLVHAMLSAPAPVIPRTATPAAPARDGRKRAPAREPVAAAPARTAHAPAAHAPAAASASSASTATAETNGERRKRRGRRGGRRR